MLGCWVLVVFVGEGVVHMWGGGGGGGGSPPPGDQKIVPPLARSLFTKVPLPGQNLENPPLCPPLAKISYAK